MHPESSALEDATFLLRSSNRLDVLEAVRRAPRTRHELREATDTSRVTLSRILGDLEDRGWIARAGRRYEPTTAGTVVASEVMGLLDNLETVEALGSTLGWLPVEAFDFELSRLADATIVSPTDRDLTATVKRMTHHVHRADRVRNVATGISYEVVEAYLEAAARDGRRIETVMHGRVFDVVDGDPDLRGALREMVAADAISVRRYDGDDAPVLATVFDDLVVLCGRSDQGSAPEALETDDEAVLAWAESYFEAVRAESRPVEADAFTP